MGFLHPLNTDIQPPERFTYPFCYEPHPLCEMAAKEVQAHIADHGVSTDHFLKFLYYTSFLTPHDPFFLCIW
jgi:hypothetical protein